MCLHHTFASRRTWSQFQIASVVSENFSPAYQHFFTIPSNSSFRSGVGVAQAAYQSAVEPYFSTISALRLPSRQPRGSAANYERSRVVGNALNQKRIATKVAGG